MATISELEAQISALAAQLDDLIKKWTQETFANTKRLMEEQNSFTRSLAIISATVASFSLLLLQLETSVVNFIDPKLVLGGFVTLLVNVLFSLVALRLWLLIEYDDKSKDLDGLSVASNALKTVNEYKTEESIQRNIDEVLERLEKLMSAMIDSEDPLYLKRHVFIRNWVVGISSGLMGLGIFLIIASLKEVFF